MSELTFAEFSEIYRAQAVETLPGFGEHTARFTSDDALAKLYAVTVKLIENAKKFNLTSILEPAEIVRKHLIDSIIPLGLLNGAGYGFTSLLDIGTGAGFPLLPMACVTDEGTSFTGLDSTAKKISHILETASFAGLRHVSAVSGRAEELARSEMAGNFDLVCARAVASLPVLLEISCRFLKKDGIFAALKSHVDEEIGPADNAAKLLGLKRIDRIDYELPGGDLRCLVIYRKIAPAPAKYPRRYSEITKNPLH